MKYSLEQQTQAIQKNRRYRKWWHRVLSVLACVTVFCTTYALVLPAITLTNEYYCGKEEHTEHTEECYKSVLICGYDDGEGEQGEESKKDEAAEPQPTHTHTDECYEQESRTLICAEQEHQHDDACYELQQVEKEDGTTEEVRTLTCQLPEHIHADECYDVQKVLICNKSEEAPSDAPTEEAHIHTEACYEKKLVCEKELHKHTLICSSNTQADLETSEIWERTFADVVLTDKRNENILAIAQTQIGYQESQQNFQVAQDEITKQGYTRYGAWYGEPYADWNTMFVSFCLHHAGIPSTEVPYESVCSRWVLKLEETDPLNFHRVGGSYQPKEGDIIFFDLDREPNSFADYVGIVKEINEEASRITTIEGDREGKVQEAFYDIANPQIVAYYSLAEQIEKPQGIDFAALTKLLDELELLLQTPEQGTQIDEETIQTSHNQAEAVQAKIEESYTAATITEGEYSTLTTRLSEIYETFEQLLVKQSPDEETNGAYAPMESDGVKQAVDRCNLTLTLNLNWPDGKNPPLSVTLINQTTKEEVKTIQIEANSPTTTVTFDDLPRLDGDGNEIQYAVGLPKVDSYVGGCTIESSDVTNVWDKTATLWVKASKIESDKSYLLLTGDAVGSGNSKWIRAEGAATPTQMLSQEVALTEGPIKAANGTSYSPYLKAEEDIGGALWTAKKSEKNGFIFYSNYLTENQMPGYHLQTITSLEKEKDATAWTFEDGKITGKNKDDILYPFEKVDPIYGSVRVVNMAAEVTYTSTGQAEKNQQESTVIQEAKESQDEPGYRLPETGGCGTKLFYTGGTAMIFCGFTIAVISSRLKRERRRP